MLHLAARYHITRGISMNKRTGKPFLRWVLVLGVIGVIAGGIYCWTRSGTGKNQEISYTSFIDRIKAGEIAEVNVAGDAITAKGKSGRTFILFRPMDADLSALLLQKHIEYSAKPMAAQVRWVEMSMLLLLIVPLLFIMRKMTVVGRTKSRLVKASESVTCFSDVAGADEAKYELMETVEFLRDPVKFNRLGGKMPTGALLVGPPGTGKTLLARAVAGEAGVPFFCMSGSEFVEMYVGVGASRVRDLFAQAKKMSPCIIFIDELDAVGRRRDSAASGASDERDQTLNQLLVEMDGFSVNSGIVVLAATNRPEILDPALLRPGRFDRQVSVGNPDIRGREEILNVHARKVPLSEEVDLQVVARETPGLSGADLANLLNEAAIQAARGNKTSVDMADIDAARDKILMGAEKKSMVLSEKAKLTTAYHEAGHVMVAKLVPGCDPVHKVSIIPRGRALGVTVQIPEEDIYCYTRDMILCHIKVLMGGRAAEELIFGTTTTGAGNDIARATDMARKMVCEWGMSEAFGPVAFGTDAAGSGDPAAKGCSDATALQIDSEIRSIVTTAYSEVSDLLRGNRDGMERLVKELLVHETLSAVQIDAALEPALPSAA